MSFEVLHDQEARKLEKPFLEEEVFAALLELNGDKAPGLDGFSMAFCHFSWGFVKSEVLCFFNEFHEHGRLVKSLNNSFLVLIPKKKGQKILRIIGLLAWWEVCTNC